MAGIYFHIPFCKQACIYCNFHFKAGKHDSLPMTKAMAKELRLRKEDFPHEKINTIYFGGGTPSLLQANQIEELLQSVLENFEISPLAEITLEANPDDLHAQKLKELKQLGINRLSIGIQTFNEDALKWMNRAHTPDQAIHCVQEAQQQGIENISIDLISGIPNLPTGYIRKDIETALALSPKHLSCYSLTLEPGTSWERLIKLKNYAKPQEEQQASEFEETMKILAENGWLHYEISNFALSEEWVSKHNSAYWQQEAYIGLGPSAHSFYNQTRSWNLNNHSHYLQALTEGELPPAEKEKIDNITAFNEAIMTGFRTLHGVNINTLHTIHPIFTEKFLTQAKTDHRIEVQSNSVKIKQNHFLFADGIASDYFVL